MSTKVTTKRGGDLLDDFLTGAPAERTEATRRAVDNEAQIQKEMRDGPLPAAPAPRNDTACMVDGQDPAAGRPARATRRAGKTRVILRVDLFAITYYTQPPTIAGLRSPKCRNNSLRYSSLALYI